jgi:hypothetical protein
MNTMSLSPVLSDSDIMKCLKGTMGKVNIFETQLNYKKVSHSLESVCACENSPGVQNLVHIV